MSVSVEETQNELAQLFPNIETGVFDSFFNDSFVYYVHPGVVKLEKIMRHLKKRISYGLEYKAHLHDIHIYIDEPKLYIDTYGGIYIEKDIDQVEMFEIIIHNHHPENRPVFIEFRYVYFSTELDFEIGFYGRVELEVDQKITKITLIPESKVYVFYPRFSG